jgi:hypothetical protein
MGFPPFASTVTNDLGLFEVGPDLAAMVFAAAPTLAVWLTTGALVRLEL